jgi:hypothetical protein
MLAPMILDENDSATVAYLRDQATNFRELARGSRDPNVRRQLSALARQCEELGLAIEDGPTYKRGPRNPVNR